MLRFLIVVCALFLHCALAQEELNGDASFEIPNLNDTELEEPTFRFQIGPKIITDKRFAVNTYQKVNWFEAQQICSYQGLTLASLNTAREADELDQFLRINSYTSRDEIFWTSGTNLGDADRWVWLSSGRALVYKNWLGDEPVNVERALRLLPDGKWDDALPSEKHYFICENRCVI